MRCLVVAVGPSVSVGPSDDEYTVSWINENHALSMVTDQEYHILRS